MRDGAGTLERLLSTVLTVSVIALLGLIAKRELAREETTAAPANLPPELEVRWTDIKKHGVVLGDTSAPIHVVEFSDLECPACRFFHGTTYARLKERLGDRVSLRFVHFPLSIHRFAKQAAEAAECAGQSGSFEQFLTTVFAKQDSIGLKSWVGYARDAGITDSLQFSACLQDPATRARVSRDRELGDAMGLSRTPTILINGLRFSVPPNDEQIRRIADSLMGRIEKDH